MKNNYLKGVIRFFQLDDYELIKEAGSEIEDEIDFHIQQRKEKLIGIGVSPGIASVKASEQFGDVFEVRKSCLDNSGLRQLLNFRKLILCFLGVGLLVFVHTFEFKSEKQRLVTSELAKTNEPDYLFLEDSQIAELGIDVKGWSEFGVAELPNPNAPVKVFEHELTVLKLPDLQFDTNSTEAIKWQFRKDDAPSPSVLASQFVIHASPNSNLSIPTYGWIRFDKAVIGVSPTLSPSTKELRELDYLSGWHDLTETSKIALYPDRQGIRFVLAPGSPRVSVKVTISNESNSLVHFGDIQSLESHLSEATEKEKGRVYKMMLDSEFAGDSSWGRFRKKIMEKLVRKADRTDLDNWERSLRGTAAHNLAFDNVKNRRIADILRITERFMEDANNDSERYPNCFFALNCYRAWALLQEGKFGEARKLCTTAIEHGIRFGDHLTMSCPYGIMSTIGECSGQGVQSLNSLRDILELAIRNKDENEQLKVAANFARILVHTGKFSAAEELLANVEATRLQFPESKYAHELLCWKAIVEAGKGVFDGEYQSVKESTYGETDFKGPPESTAYFYYYAVYFVEAFFNENLALALDANQRCAQYKRNNSLSISREHFNKSLALAHNGKLNEAIEILKKLEGKFGVETTAEVKRLRLLSGLCSVQKDDSTGAILNQYFALEKKVQEADDNTIRQLLSRFVPRK